MADPIRDALSAVERAKAVIHGLDQSQRLPDVRQVANGLGVELLIIESSLRSALGAALGTATADRPGLVASDAPATSRAAARGISVRSGTQRGSILRALLDSGYLTDHELCNATALEPSSERPRRVELVDLGLVSTRGTTKVHGGTEWTIWELTPLGRSVANELRRLGPKGSVKIDPNQCVEPDDQVAEDSSPEGDPVLF
jgi:hypothetical protein